MLFNIPQNKINQSDKQALQNKSHMALPLLTCMLFHATRERQGRQNWTYKWHYSHIPLRWNRRVHIALCTKWVLRYITPKRHVKRMHSITHVRYSTRIRSQTPIHTRLHASPVWIKGRGTRRHHIVLSSKVLRGFPLQIYKAFKTQINYLKNIRNATTTLQFSKLSVFITRATKRNPVLRKISSNIRQKGKGRAWTYHLQACRRFSFPFSFLKNQKQCEIDKTSQRQPTDITYNIVIDCRTLLLIVFIWFQSLVC